MGKSLDVGCFLEEKSHSELGGKRGGRGSGYWWELGFTLFTTEQSPLAAVGGEGWGIVKAIMASALPQGSRARTPHSLSSWHVPGLLLVGSQPRDRGLCPWERCCQDELIVIGSVRW